MVCEKIFLSGDSGAYLETYVLGNSQEFDKDKLRRTVLVLPGGAYAFTSDREAEFIALGFAAKGFHAVVLRYSVKKGAAMPQPILEAFQAMALIREKAAEWHVDPQKIAVCGFSAGGHLASCAMTFWKDKAILEKLGKAPEDIKPNAGILCYPCIVFPFRTPPKPGEASPDTIEEVRGWLREFMGVDSQEDVSELAYVKDGAVWQDFSKTFDRIVMGRADFSPEELAAYSTDKLVDADTPPAFIWTTRTDATVPIDDSLDFATAMLRKGRPFELHIYADGNHGLSLATEETAVVNERVETWFPLAVSWLKKTLA
jgi:acetyl esterase/lipase